MNISYLSWRVPLFPLNELSHHITSIPISLLFVPVSSNSCVLLYNQVVHKLNFGGRPLKCGSPL